MEEIALNLDLRKFNSIEDLTKNIDQIIYEKFCVYFEFDYSYFKNIFSKNPLIKIHYNGKIKNLKYHILGEFSIFNYQNELFRLKELNETQEDAILSVMLPNFLEIQNDHRKNLQTYINSSILHGLTTIFKNKKYSTTISIYTIPSSLDLQNHVDIREISYEEVLKFFILCSNPKETLIQKFVKGYSALMASISSNLQNISSMSSVNDIVIIDLLIYLGHLTECYSPIYLKTILTQIASMISNHYYQLEIQKFIQT